MVVVTRGKSTPVAKPDTPTSKGSRPRRTKMKPRIEIRIAGLEVS
jgi:hypothetical protein